MYSKGVIRVGDMLDNSYRVLPLQDFKLKYKLGNVHFTVYHGILSTILIHWNENMAAMYRNIQDVDVTCPIVVISRSI